MKNSQKTLKDFSKKNGILKLEKVQKSKVKGGTVVDDLDLV